ncbi:MAG TPA: alkaline phosphatase family protein [bacterium]|nr:alkaline phosphatase family protein [bacterium]
MDPIKHVVLLMLENHSFDEMLGCFQPLVTGLDGIDPKAPPRFNVDPRDGTQVQQVPKQNYCMQLDPIHEYVNVQTQLEDGNAGFVKDFVTQYGAQKAAVNRERAYIMGYYPLGHLPALHALARDFLICDRWFASLPGPTWPNRFFALSGTCSGEVRMPIGPTRLDDLKVVAAVVEAETQDTLFDRLDAAGKKARVYYYDMPSSLILEHQRHPERLLHYHGIDEFFGQDARGPEAQFPDFALIEPKYFGVDQNDDHPPHNVIKAEKLVADVYNALRSNEALWQTTLLVVVFDEHGGFYDHVPPPPAPPPDGKHPERFGRLGVRVPAILVSPWVERGVTHTVFDHTSLLKYLSDKWGLGPLGARTAAANSLAGEIKRTAPRPATDTIGSIRVPYSLLAHEDETCDEQAQSKHHEALELFAALLQRGLPPGEQDWAQITRPVTSWAERAAAWVGENVFLRAGYALTRGRDTAREQRVKDSVNAVRRFIHR